MARQREAAPKGYDTTSIDHYVWQSQVYVISTSCGRWINRLAQSIVLFCQRTLLQIPVAIYQYHYVLLKSEPDVFIHMKEKHPIYGISHLTFGTYTSKRYFSGVCRDFN